MAEPLDLSDEGIAALAPELVARVKLDGHQLVSVRAEGEKRVVHTVDAARFLTKWLQDIRDAATAAERARAERVCAYLAEMREAGAGDWPKGHRLRQAARMIHDGDDPLAALRGGDHE